MKRRHLELQLFDLVKLHDAQVRVLLGWVVDGVLVG